MSTLPVEDAKTVKTGLENNIRAAIGAFEELTGLAVTEVSVRRIYIVDKAHGELLGVDVTVKL